MALPASPPHEEEASPTQCLVPICGRATLLHGKTERHRRQKGGLWQQREHESSPGAQTQVISWTHRQLLGEASAARESWCPRSLYPMQSSHRWTAEPTWGPGFTTPSFVSLPDATERTCHPPPGANLEWFDVHVGPAPWM